MCCGVGVPFELSCDLGRPDHVVFGDENHSRLDQRLDAAVPLLQWADRGLSEDGRLVLNIMSTSVISMPLWS
jgi:hypothetical protein